jgi:hypothetical protein
MAAFMNFLADFDTPKFHVSLVIAVICLCILVSIIGMGQRF